MRKCNSVFDFFQYFLKQSDGCLVVHHCLAMFYFSPLQLVGEEACNVNGEQLNVSVTNYPCE